MGLTRWNGWFGWMGEMGGMGWMRSERWDEWDGRDGWMRWMGWIGWMGGWQRWDGLWSSIMMEDLYSIHRHLPWSLLQKQKNWRGSLYIPWTPWGSTQITVHGYHVFRPQGFSKVNILWVFEFLIFFAQMTSHTWYCGQATHESHPFHPFHPILFILAIPSPPIPPISPTHPIPPPLKRHPHQPPTAFI